MAEKEFILTDAGLKKLVDELEEYKTIKRKEVADKIKVALSFGDLSENSEYDEAKNEQAIVEARILQLETMIKNAKVVDETEITTDAVSVGCKVTVFDVEFDEEVEYYIVGSTESDPAENKISDESPVGKALIGHKVGEVVKAETPMGEIEFKIINIAK